MASSKLTKLIILIGYRGSGKSSVGKSLADRLDWAWSDSDVEVESNIGGSIAQFFDHHGEARFRALETEAIKNLIAWADDRGQVISLGGGAPMFNDNPRLWRDVGNCIYLRGSAETLHKRISTDKTSKDGRPDLTDEGGLAEVKKILDLRSRTYESCADFIVDVDEKTVDAIVDEICEFYSHVQRSLSE